MSFSRVALRNQRSGAFSIPPLVGSRGAKLALGWHIVSGANDVTGGGFGELPPTRRFAPPSPQVGSLRNWPNGYCGLVLAIFFLG